MTMTQQRIDSRSIGENVRQIRTERNLRLEDVARRAGHTKGYLSKIEQGKSTPSIATIMRLAGALGVDVSMLMQSADGGSEQDARATAHVKPSQRLEVLNDGAGPGYTYMALSAGRRRKMMEPFLLTVRPEHVDPAKVFEHPGEEFVYVISGSCDYVVGDETYFLEPGDSLYFDSTKPHAPRPKKEAVTFIAIFCAPPKSSGMRTEANVYVSAKAN
jgi:transcriptional regulator with XRE-family HTH domain